jgi:predicted O-methyltransferase YrrM
MEHFYKNVNSENWFGYEEVYSKMVSRFGDNSHFVEVGVWKGMSACYMAVEIINSGKNIKFDCVDAWEFVETSSEITPIQFKDLFQIFKSNIEPVKNNINIIKSLSWDGAKNYEDNSLDFVFIDAGHDHDSVMKDLNAWYPKIKNGGVIAGHDYHYNVGVFSAVNEFFKGTRINQINACWIVDKTQDNIINPQTSLHTNIEELNKPVFDVNLIWQTNDGDETNFEYEYLTEVLFKNTHYNSHFDKKTYQTVLDNAIIIYSNNSHNISEEFNEYLNKFHDNGYSFNLLHLSNENLEHDTVYYSKAKKVFRNYYDPNIKNTNVHFIPLGFKSGFYNKDFDNLKNFNDKKYDFCFIGEPKTDRHEMIEVLNQYNAYKHLTKSWNCSTSLSVNGCIDIYKQTKFAPCPMGFSHPDSFRFMEALEWGCIPILKKYENFNYHSQIYGESPIPKIDSWSELSNFINLNESEYNKLFSDVFKWYKKFKNELNQNIFYHFYEK